MTFSSPMRKFVLLAHVTTSVGLLGAVASFLLLSIFGIVSSNAQLVQSSYVLLMPLSTYLILPLVVASLLIGIISSLGTPWGLVRYYWVAAKLLLTSIILIVLLLQMNAIAQLSTIAANRMVTDTDVGLRIRMIIHAGGGLGMLLLIMILSLWKPKGVTPFGQHQSAQ
ncbi:MAG: hypothetical protein ABJA10_10270 [Aestuariivirga sp.]